MEPSALVAVVIVSFIFSLFAGFVIARLSDSRRVLLRLLVLYMIQNERDGKAHGQQIVKRFERLFSEALIHLTLRKLEDEGLLLHTREPAGNPDREGRPYYYYSLTDKGLKLISPPEDVESLPTSACT